MAVVTLNISYKGVFVDGLVDNDEKVAFFKKHTQFKGRVLKPYPI